MNKLRIANTTWVGELFENGSICTARFVEVEDKNWFPPGEQMQLQVT
jgi:hypothetical protein